MNSELSERTLGNVESKRYQIHFTVIAYKTKQRVTPLREKCPTKASKPAMPSAVYFNSSRKTWEPIIHCIGFHLLPLIKVNAHCFSHTQCTLPPLAFQQRIREAGPCGNSPIPHWEFFVAVTKPTLWWNETEHDEDFPLFKSDWVPLCSQNNVKRSAGLRSPPFPVGAAAGEGCTHKTVLNP